MMTRPATRKIRDGGPFDCAQGKLPTDDGRNSPFYRRPSSVVRRSFKPIWSFPASLFAEGCAELLQTRIGRGETEGTCGLAFFVGVMNVIILAVGFERARENIV